MRKLCLVLISVILIGLISCKKDEEPKPSGNVIEEDITTATTWTADETWIISGAINVNADLTIEPGTTVKFRENASLDIGYSGFGSLLAEGTSDKPIIFTSASSNPQPGDWAYLYFGENNSSSRSSLKYCTIQYGGNSESYGMLSLYKTSIKMNYCTLKQSEHIGITLESNGKFGTCENNVISDCGTNPVEADMTTVSTLGTTTQITASSNYGIYLVQYGEFKGQVTWNKFAAPYILPDGLNVSNSAANTSLTIMPGCTIKMDVNTYIWVGWDYPGKLVANGTVDQPIVITSSAGSPSPGDWAYIYFGQYTGSSSLLNYCQIMYGGSDESWGMVSIENTSNVSITNCTISYSGSYGILLNNSSSVLTNNTYSNNAGQDVYIYE